MKVQVVEDGLRAVEVQLEKAVQSDVKLLHEASQHILNSGGKRFRPRIVLLSYLAAGGTDLNTIIPLASAVELVHTATLVHDDINDHSLTRRGKITVHAQWGRTFALLTGDFLFTKVYELMAPYGAELNKVMAEACVQLVEGETLQAAAAKKGAIDQETYKNIISLKTASLFRAGARMGAEYNTPAEPETIEALGHYAYNLGLAFQIVDDILDIIGDPETLGKPVGSDLLQGSGIVMAQNGKKITSTMTETEADPIKEMMLKLRDSGAVEVARQQANIYANRALKALLQIPDSPYRSELNQVIDEVIHRNR